MLKILELNIGKHIVIIVRIHHLSYQFKVLMELFKVDLLVIEICFEKERLCFRFINVRDGFEEFVLGVEFFGEKICVLVEPEIELLHWVILSFGWFVE